MPLEVTPGEVLQVKGGAIPHSHLVGKKYGTKVSVASWVERQQSSPTNVDSLERHSRCVRAFMRIYIDVFNFGTRL